MESLFRIYTQRNENYNFDSGPAYWKPKGGFDFTLRADLDKVMYCEGEFIEAVKAMLEKASNPMERFEFLGYDLVNEPVMIDQKEFDTIFNKLIQDHALPVS